MKKMPEKKESRLHVIVNDCILYHGDFVLFKPNREFSKDDEDGCPPCKGRICLDKQEPDENGKVLKFYVCQNEHDGDSSADEKFGYEYSWVVKVNNDGIIESSDTEYVKPRVVQKEQCNPCDASEIFNKEIETFYIFDDDQMPEDWECDIDLTQLKTELNAYS